MTCRRQSRSSGGLYLESTRAERFGVLPGEERPVREVMNRRVISIAPSTSLWDAAAIMRREQTSAVVVRDPERVYGLLTDRDLGLSLIAGTESVSTAGDLVGTRKHVTLCEDDIVADGWALLKRHGLDAMSVVDGQGTVVGVLSWVDLAASVQPDSAGVWLDHIRR